MDTMSLLKGFYLSQVCRSLVNIWFKWFTPTCSIRTRLSSSGHISKLHIVIPRFYFDVFSGHWFLVLVYNLPLLHSER